MRPADLAREHGISTQAVRNYERDGCLPPAERTRSGYRIYTEAHAAALRAFLALIPAHGHSASSRIMNSIHSGLIDDALMVIDRSHDQLLRDRSTLDSVRKAVDHLTDAASDQPSDSLSIGELARRLDVTPATLRNWEDVGILVPARTTSGHRVFDTSDIRDAELAHLLRRGGYPLTHISTVVQQVRTAGGTDTLASALDNWQQRLTALGLAMLNAAAHLNHYLSVKALLVGRFGDHAGAGCRGGDQRVGQDVGG